MDWLTWNNIARHLVAWMADTSARVAVLAILVLLLVPFIRRSSTAQHTAWTVVLAGMLVLPFLRSAAPPIHIHFPKVQMRRPLAPAPIRSNANASGSPAAVSPAADVTPPEARRVLPSTWPLFVVIAYLAGVILFGARLLGGVLLMRRALQNTRNIQSELWEHYELIADTNIDLSLEESDSVRAPLTTGSDRIRVILPADWRAWPVEKRTAVLAHELAHARRRDPLVALVIAVSKCLYWFHPLAWWLARRLSVLAEHAADDAALAVSFDAQSYARLLLDSAARLDRGGSRLIWYSAMTGPVVAKRIRRVLDMRSGERPKPTGKFRRALLLCLGATLLWISTAVDIPSLAAQQPDSSSGVNAGVLPAGLVTSEQAAAMEQELAANPEDETTRGKLLRYYGWAEMCANMRTYGMHAPPGCGDYGAQEAADRRIPLVLWLIDHHPESELLGNGLTSMSPPSPSGYEEIRNHWATQVNLHPNDARVLGNASRGDNNLPDAIDLLKRARNLDAAHWTEPLVRIYSSILVWANETGTQVSFKDPGLAAQIRDELQNSNDVSLVGSVAKEVVEAAAREGLFATVRTAQAGVTRNWNLTALKTLATELVTHAQTMEPENQEWSDLMEGVKRLQAAAALSVAPAAPASAQTIRVGGAVAASNLHQSLPPIYPPDAKFARVEGTVKLQILIGADGHVKETTTISGNPMLINAAMDAAQQYVYEPTMLNGQPVQVVTEVDIVFRLAQP